MANPIRLLRTLGLIEGVSFLVLVGVAMPLKYWGGLPHAVKVVGWAHGVLFIAVCVALLRVMVVARWPLARGVTVVAAALLPAGPFLIDGRMKRYEREFEDGEARGTAARVVVVVPEEQVARNREVE